MPSRHDIFWISHGGDQRATNEGVQGALFYAGRPGLGPLPTRL